MTDQGSARQAQVTSISEQLREMDGPIDGIPLSGPLVDSYERRIKNLRISITDKCNFRCV